MLYKHSFSYLIFRMKSTIYCLVVFVVIFGGVGSVALAADKQHVFEDEQIKLQLFPRTPNQMAGFYEARGFPKEMVNVLAGFCFMTVVIHNKTRDVFWLDIDSWEFNSDVGKIQRIHRKEWPARWKKMNIPMAFQSTFRWTLLPEKLKFFPDEHEGGNVILVRTKNAFSLHAGFKVGENKDKGLVMARINNVQCAENVIEKGGDQ